MDYKICNKGNFEPVVDEQKKIITINAVYFTAKENEAKLQEAINAWNAKSMEYNYINNEETYNIIFNLTIGNGNFANNDAAVDAHQVNIVSGQTNYYKVADTGKHPITAMPILGKTEHGNTITVRNKDDVRTIMHEIGHTLGLKEWSTALMESGGKGTAITQRNIATILHIAGIGIPIDNTQYPHYELPVSPKTETHIGKPSRIYKMNTGKVKKNDKY